MRTHVSARGYLAPALRYYRWVVGIHLLLMLSWGASGQALAQESIVAKAPNVLLITLDDMSQDSLGIYGCKVDNITPNMDRLARQSFRFEHAHVTIAVCQPSRAVWMTGRYPHRNGALGFETIRSDVPTLPEHLRDQGYFLGLYGKTNHVVPSRARAWHVRIPAGELGHGRRSDLYHHYVAAGIDAALEAEKPFFLMVNIHDPHRPFAISEENLAASQQLPSPDGDGPRSQPIPRAIHPEEVHVPPFLPDVPAVRKELAQYYSSVFRADVTVGEILKALDESGQSANTIVMLLSDHGMPLPFAKTNCYLQSTRTPWMIRWPGNIGEGEFDQEHMVSGIDLAPTVLDLLGLPPIQEMDGRSFKPVLFGDQQSDRDFVLTHFHRTSGKREYPMRSIITRQAGYIWNPWSDGETVFRNESQSGLTMAAMQRNADKIPGLAERVQLFLYRVPEELYEYQVDPYALENLTADPRQSQLRSALRERLLEQLRATKDPLADDFSEWLLSN